MKVKQIGRILGFGALLASVFTAGAYAEDVLKRVEAYLRPDFNVVLDGKPIKMENDPLVYEGSSYLPVKELGNLLGANITFKDDTKTIYINSRLYKEQPVQDPNIDYQEIKMRDPLSNIYVYLGSEYPALIIGNDTAIRDSNKYWRLSDVKRMGIDVTGLTFVKEKLTQQLYVSESELKKKWRQAPTVSYNRPRNSYNYIVAGEVDNEKIEAIQKYIKDTSSIRTTTVTLSTKPIIVDTTSDTNIYQYMFWQNAQLTDGKYVNNRLMTTRLRIYKGYNEDFYTINSDNQLDLQSELDDRERKKNNPQDATTTP
ncbi:stalk domain-containing protein [Paenibacillus thalictri]|uniref:Copper amine oxidase-like N-terminal domain-containing protein n=1 Tax=Paenibacillus thalictri TaxID=2527873 RepID=A0A4Q9DPL7_9BACL|nr:hypothetical protein [Paenibacillus thalictri]TBL78255.1 hypothetical protein EYB31_15410 [Paenibacillus thalictri]